MKNIDFEKELRNLEFARNHYLNELIALLSYKDEKMLELNKARALGGIELTIKTMEELREVIK